MVSDRVTCPDCGFVGNIETHGADDVLGGMPQAEDVFRLQGKDEKDHLILKCPACHTDNTYLISGGFLMKVGHLLLSALLLAGACFLARQLIAWLFH